MRADCDRTATLTQEDDTARSSDSKSVELRLIFPANQMAVRAALHNTMSGLGAMCLSDDDTSTVELVLAEVLNNVSEHAYRDDPLGLIELHLKQGARGLTCRVIDRGDPMPGMRPPPSRTPDPAQPRDLLPEGGFGWYLIHHLSRKLNYMRDGDRNVLSLEIDVTQSVMRN